MTHTLDDLDEILRVDLVAFFERSFATLNPGTALSSNWHINAIAEHLRNVHEGSIRRLIITMPPRYLKSHCVTIAYPAWSLGRNPSKRIIAASYSADLAADHARACKAIMQSSWYRRAFSNTLIHPRHNTEMDFSTTRHGRRIATSVGGTLTGLGGSQIIIDDPMKPSEAHSQARRKTVADWYDNTVYSRLDQKKSDSIILVQQRLHVDDLVAHVLERDKWIHLDLPAIAERRTIVSMGRFGQKIREPGDILHPEREPKATLDEIKSNMGSASFTAQYQQMPVPIEGNAFKWQWFRRYGHIPADQWQGDMVVQSWDCGMTAHDGSDWSVCTTWAVRGGLYYLADVFRGRLDFPNLKRKVVELKKHYAPKIVLIESKGTGLGLIQQLRHDRLMTPRPIDPVGSKEDRAVACSALIEQGLVYLPMKAPWLDDLQTEISSFPHGKHDDQVDSITQFLNWHPNRPRVTVYS